MHLARRCDTPSRRLHRRVVSDPSASASEAGRKVIYNVLLAIAPTRGQSGLTPQRRGPLGNRAASIFPLSSLYLRRAISRTSELIARSSPRPPRSSVSRPRWNRQHPCRVIARTPARPRDRGTPSNARASIRETRSFGRVSLFLPRTTVWRRSRTRTVRGPGLSRRADDADELLLRGPLSGPTRGAEYGLPPAQPSRRSGTLELKREAAMVA
jgi:hypothetical protein